MSDQPVVNHSPVTPAMRRQVAMLPPASAVAEYFFEGKLYLTQGHQGKRTVEPIAFKEARFVKDRILVSHINPNTSVTFLKPGKWAITDFLTGMQVTHHNNLAKAWTEAVTLYETNNLTFVEQAIGVNGREYDQCYTDLLNQILGCRTKTAYFALQNAMTHWLDDSFEFDPDVLPLRIGSVTG